MIKIKIYKNKTSERCQQPSRSGMIGRHVVLVCIYRSGMPTESSLYRKLRSVLHDIINDNVLHHEVIFFLTAAL